MKRFWLMIICFCFCSSVHAQWQKQVLPTLSKKGLSSRIISSVERKVLPARYQAKLANQATLKLIRNYHPELGSLDDHLSSAFVIEENTQGTPRLWGVTVQHYEFNRPAIEHPSLQKAFPITLQAAGQKQYSDVALFELPEQVKQKITPLKLAGTLPKPGEEVSSYGYYHTGFQQLRHRFIKAVTPARLVTSYEFSPFTDRHGACGGPVLNAQNEVVGIHNGSSFDLQNSFVVPVTHIRRLLNAYYHQNKTTDPLFFNGQKIYELSVNQALSRVVAFRKGYPVEDVQLYGYNALLEPAHVEKLFFTPDADGVLLYINQADFTTNEPLPELQVFCDLKTGKIIQKPQ